MNDERVRELVVDAYRGVRLDVPQSVIEQASRHRIRRAPVLVAVAFSVLVVTAGVSLVAGGSGPSLVVGDGDDLVSTTPSLAVAESCGDPLPVRGGTAPLVRRVTLPDVGLEIHASESIVLICWHGPLALVKDSAAEPLFPAGQLTARSTELWYGDESVGFTFGRTPVGTTAVKVHFADGSSIDARVEGEWFAAAAPGSDASKFNEVVRVVAQTPSGPVTHEPPRSSP